MFPEHHEQQSGSRHRLEGRTAPRRHHLLNRYRLKMDRTFRWRPNGPAMNYLREHAVGDYLSGGFGGNDEMQMLVHGQIGSAHAALLSERLSQDFSQQHLADQKLPEKDKRPYTLVVGMRSWLFEAFRRLLREPQGGP